MRSASSSWRRSASPPAYLQTFVESEIDKWAVPIKTSGVKED